MGLSWQWFGTKILEWNSWKSSVPRQKGLSLACCTKNCSCTGNLTLFLIFSPSLKCKMGRKIIKTPSILAYQKSRMNPLDSKCTGISTGMAESPGILPGNPQYSCLTVSLCKRETVRGEPSLPSGLAGALFPFHEALKLVHHPTDSGENDAKRHFYFVVSNPVIKLKKKKKKNCEEEEVCERERREAHWFLLQMFSAPCHLVSALSMHQELIFYGEVTKASDSCCQHLSAQPWGEKSAHRSGGYQCWHPDLLILGYISVRGRAVSASWDWEAKTITSCVASWWGWHSPPQLHGAALQQQKSLDCSTRCWIPGIQGSVNDKFLL